MTFADHVIREADMVLDDHVFRRSPTQARLLRYLVERTVRNAPPPTQYDIAVEGLGKPADFDLSNDSYPRVQVSRLRNNLDNYYARNLPHAGRRLTIEPGEYTLKLVPVEMPGAAAAAGQDPAKAAASGTVFAQAEPDDPAYPVLYSANAPAISAGAPPAPPGERGGTLRRVAGYALIAFLSAFATAMAFGGGWLSGRDPEPPTGEPTIAIASDFSGLEGNGDADLDMAELAARHAEIMASYSLVSRIAAPDSEENPDYRIDLNFVQAPGEDLRAFVILTDRDGDVMFRSRAQYDRARPDAFVETVKASIVTVVSPNGIVADDRFASLEDPLASGYGCFLAIEARRDIARAVDDLLDECASRHQDSAYMPFFRARRALAYYQDRIRQDLPVRRAGPGWADLNRALQQDPYDPWANFIVAKLLLREDGCEAAELNMQIATERARTNPILLGAIDIEAQGCPGYGPEIGMSRAELARMIASNPSPSPLEYLVMLTAAVAADDMHSAATLTARSHAEAGDGIRARLTDMLHESLEKPEFASANEARMRRDLELFIWSDAAIEKVMETLASRRA
ncbi:MAG: hypothetical protein RIB52_07250 [Erythrobacter sp.]|uniref:hypothetical protein n=1 Tax=Erythrobacter sp. TaxID=1042 RepID=UPI0032EC34EA